MKSNKYTKVYLNVNEVFVKSQMDGEKGYLEYR